MKSLPQLLLSRIQSQLPLPTSLRSKDPIRETHTQINKTITAIINNPIKLIFKR